MIEPIEFMMTYKSHSILVKRAAGGKRFCTVGNMAFEKLQNAKDYIDGNYKRPLSVITDGRNFLLIDLHNYQAGLQEIVARFDVDDSLQEKVKAFFAEKPYRPDEESKVIFPWLK